MEDGKSTASGNRARFTPAQLREMGVRFNNYPEWRASCHFSEFQEEKFKEFIESMSPVPGNSTSNALRGARNALQADIPPSNLLEICLYHYNMWAGSHRFIFEVIDLLLIAGADVDSRNPSTPCFPLVITACQAGKYDILEKIHAGGGNLNAMDTTGSTAFTRAAWNRNTKCLKRLLQIGVAIDASYLFQNLSKEKFGNDHRNGIIQVIDEHMGFMKIFHENVKEIKLCQMVHSFDEFIIRFCFDVEGIQKLWTLIQEHWDTSILNEKQNGISCIIS